MEGPTAGLTQGLPCLIKNTQQTFLGKVRFMESEFWRGKGRQNWSDFYFTCHSLSLSLGMKPNILCLGKVYLLDKHYFSRCEAIRNRQLYPSSEQFFSPHYLVSLTTKNAVIFSFKEQPQLLANILLVNWRTFKYVMSIPRLWLSLLIIFFLLSWKVKLLKVSLWKFSPPLRHILQLFFQKQVHPVL